MNIEKYTERARGFIQSAQTAGARQGPPAVHAAAPAQGAARRRRGHGGGPHRAGRRQPQGGAGRGRGGAREDPKRFRRRLAALSQPRTGAGVRHRRERGAEGRRFVRHRRAAAAGAGDREGHRCGQDPAVGGRHAAGAQRGDQRNPQGPHGRFGLGREQLRCAQEVCARPDRRRCATASSIRSSAATRRSAAPSRC